MNLADYRTLRTGAGCIEAAGRGWLAVRGGDRADFLQGLLTNDVAALAPGSGCYAACLTPQGRMIADMYVFAEPDRLLLEVDGGVAEKLRDRFDDLVFTEDVAITDVTAESAAYGVHGPRAHAVAATLAGGAPPGRMAVGEHCTVDGGEAGPVLVARTDDLGIDGYRLLGRRSASPALGRALEAAGAVAVEAAAAETVRIESGRPVFPTDMDGGTIPLEAGIAERAISFDKGCYVGQEVIVRILHRGQGRVARRLAGLVLTAPGQADPPQPSAGAEIFAGSEQVGHVTSAVRSPAAGSVIALGYVRRALADVEGAQVEVAVGADRAPAAVAALPFVPSGVAASDGAIRSRA